MLYKNGKARTSTKKKSQRVFNARPPARQLCQCQYERYLLFGNNLLTTASPFRWTHNNNNNSNPLCRIVGSQASQKQQQHLAKTGSITTNCFKCRNCVHRGNQVFAVDSCHSGGHSNECDHGTIRGRFVYQLDTTTRYTRWSSRAVPASMHDSEIPATLLDTQSVSSFQLNGAQTKPPTILHFSPPSSTRTNNHE